MTNPKQTPGCIELITRAEIIKLTGVSKTKIMNITLSKTNDFPRPVCAMAHNTTAYNKTEVVQWLKRNNIKSTPAPSPYAFVNYGSNEKKDMRYFDNALAVAFITGKLASANV